MNLKWIVIALAVVLGIGIIILVATNNILLFGLIICLAFAVYFYFAWKKSLEGPTPPYTLLKIRLLRAISQCNPRTLGYLVLRGDNDFQRVTLGKMTGIVKITLDQDEELSESGAITKKNGKETKAKDSGNAWRVLYVIGYKTRDGFLWNLPIINSFVPVELFACAEHQLYDKPGVGDLRLRGVSIEPVFCFWMLNAVDLEKDYIAHGLSGEVNRITLEQYFNKLPSLIDNAVKSDGFQTKIKELLSDKPKGRSGIVV